LEALRVAAEGKLDDRIQDLVEAAGGRGLAEADLRAKVGHPPAEVAAAVEQLAGDGRIRRIGRKVLVGADAIERTGGAIVAILDEHAKNNPLSWGPTKSELKSRLEKKVHPEIVEAWLREKGEAGEVHVREDRARFGEADVKLSPRHEDLRKRILADLGERGFTAPTTRELLEAHRSDKDVEELLGHLVRSGEVVRIPPDLHLPAAAIEKMRALLGAHFETQREMNVAAFKEILGVSRKQAVPLLEWIDRERWTERVGDVRVEGPRLRE
ncbi:MAG: hypothetical protein GF346_12240, partial [Candidatus Eisenbacteria bacterium]|nr:hypothetical protein [Candidatus Latescibacterota bacterium]MBD3303205.1 hypothetical protein [Candidatus Eisenbacteria bacterium]